MASNCLNDDLFNNESVRSHFSVGRDLATLDYAFMLLNVVNSLESFGGKGIFSCKFPAGKNVKSATMATKKRNDIVKKFISSDDKVRWDITVVS